MGATKAQKLVKSMKPKVETKNPIGTELILPNNSGDHTRGTKRDAPAVDADLANKKYVDDEITILAATADTTFLKLDASNDPISENLVLTKGLTVNEGGGDNDFRVETTGNTHTFFINAETEQIGINTATPGPGIRLHVNGKLQCTNFVNLGSTVLNSGSIDKDTIIRGDNEPNLIRADAGNDRVGIGTGTPSSKLQVAGKITAEDSSTGGVSDNVEIETDGDVVFNGGGGLQFGEIYCQDANSSHGPTASGKVNKIQVTAFDTNGVSNGNATPDHTNDHITVGKAGMYMCTISLAIRSAGGSAYQLGISAYKNNGATEFGNVHSHIDVSGAGGDSTSISMSGIIDCAANDTIELWIWNETNTNAIIIDECTLSLIQIGGT